MKDEMKRHGGTSLFCCKRCNSRSRKSGEHKRYDRRIARAKMKQSLRSAMRSVDSCLVTGSLKIYVAFLLSCCAVCNISAQTWIDGSDSVFIANGDGVTGRILTVEDMTSQFLSYARKAYPELPDDELAIGLQVYIESRRALLESPNEGPTVASGPETIAAYSDDGLQRVIEKATEVRQTSLWVVFSTQNGDGNGINTLLCNGHDISGGICNWQAQRLATKLSTPFYDADAPGVKWIVPSIQHVWLMLAEEETTNDSPFDAPGLSTAQQDLYRSAIQPFVDAGISVTVVVAGEEGIKDEHRSGAWSVAKITQHAQWIKSTWPGVETALHNWPGADDAGDVGPDGNLYWKVDFHDFAWDNVIDWFCIQTDINGAAARVAYWRGNSNKKICLAEVGPWQRGVPTDDELAQGGTKSYGGFLFTDDQYQILNEHIRGAAPHAIVFYPGPKDQSLTYDEWNPGMHARSIQWANWYYAGLLDWILGAW